MVTYKHINCVRKAFAKSLIWNTLFLEHCVNWTLKQARNTYTDVYKRQEKLDKLVIIKYQPII